MAASPPSTTTISLVLLFFLSLPHIAVPQDPSSPGTSIAQCGPSLLQLVSCIPFVQGSAQTPVQMCCDNLRQLYGRQPHCLCLLLNNSNLSSYPINTTLAQQLPDLCSLQVDISTCSGTFVPPSNAPSSQVSFGGETNSSTNYNSSTAASPVVSVTPRSTIIGLGFHHSGVAKLKMKENLRLVLLLATFLFSIFFS